MAVRTRSSTGLTEAEDVAVDDEIGKGVVGRKSIIHDSRLERDNVYVLFEFVVVVGPVVDVEGRVDDVPSADDGDGGTKLGGRRYA